MTCTQCRRRSGTHLEMCLAAHLGAHAPRQASRRAPRDRAMRLDTHMDMCLHQYMSERLGMPPHVHAGAAAACDLDIYQAIYTGDHSTASPGGFKARLELGRWKEAHGLQCTETPTASPSVAPTLMPIEHQTVTLTEVRHATRSMQHATCNMQPGTCNMQHATCNVQHATCNMQHIQHATCNMQVDRARRFAPQMRARV